MLSIIMPATDLEKANEMMNEVEMLFPSNVQIIVSSNRQSLGKGYAVREALKQATGEFVCFLDGDGDISPIMIKRLIPFIVDYDIVLGCKPISGLWSRRILTYWSRLYIALLFGVKVSTQTGIKLFKRHALNEWYNNGYLFELEIIALAKQKGMTMIEVPIEATVNKRMKIQSIWNTFKDSLTLWLELR